jgi:Zn finger protein HypA/HybF involved in hydrogenase expression
MVNRLSSSSPVREKSVNCTECGELLSPEEIEFYGHTCNQCEREWFYLERAEECSDAVPNA